MGIHTGDFGDGGAALSSRDKEYQIMREASIACLREIGVDTGGSKCSSAGRSARPPHGRDRDEPRVSRSSALASKARASRSPKVRGAAPSATRSTNY